MKCVGIAPLLCLGTILLVQVSFQKSGRSTCPCLKLSRDVLRKRDVKNYVTQKATVCHIDAIIFIKTAGGITCSNPQKPWVKRAMQYLDKKRAAENKMTKHEKFTSADMGSGNGQDDRRTITPELFVNTVIGSSVCPCLKTSEIVLPKGNIRSYKKQHVDVCHIDAVEFETVQGLTFCSNPQKPWVKRAMQFMDTMKRADETTVHSLNSVSVFHSGPALSTTSHWNGQNEPELFEKVTICL